MRLLKILALSMTAVLSLGSCKSEYELLLSGNDVDAKYAAAFDYFSQGKYSKAAQLFESMTFAVSGTEKEDTVLYYRGLSNYRFKDFYTAETNFSTFLESFPRSPFSSDARFLRLDCLYKSTLRYELDQTPTKTAIAAINQYMSDFPGNDHQDMCNVMLVDLEERLDRKAFENARLYYKMEKYLSSKVAFKNVLKDDADNQYREDILYYTAMSSYKYALNSIPEKQKERYMSFVDDYLNFAGEYPDSKYSRELAGLYKKVQKLLGRGGALLESVENAEDESAEGESEE